MILCNRGLLLLFPSMSKYNLNRELPDQVLFCITSRGLAAPEGRCVQRPAPKKCLQGRGPEAQRAPRPVCDSLWPVGVGRGGVTPPGLGKAYNFSRGLAAPEAALDD